MEQFANTHFSLFAVRTDEKKIRWQQFFTVVFFRFPFFFCFVFWLLPHFGFLCKCMMRTFHQAAAIQFILCQMCEKSVIFEKERKNALFGIVIYVWCLSNVKPILKHFPFICDVVVVVIMARSWTLLNLMGTFILCFYYYYFLSSSRLKVWQIFVFDLLHLFSPTLLSRAFGGG